MHHILDKSNLSPTQSQPSLAVIERFNQEHDRSIGEGRQLELAI